MEGPGASEGKKEAARLSPYGTGWWAEPSLHIDHDGLVIYDEDEDEARYQMGMRTAFEVTD